MSSRINQSHATAGGDVVAGDKVSYTFNLPDSGLADEAIEAELSKILRKRHFNEYDRIAASKRLAENCLHGRYASGKDVVRARALAWCARLISVDDTELASQYLSCAKDIADLQDIDIADAFLVSKQCGKADALRNLAAINHPSARTASLAIVAQHDELAGALEWYESAGLGPKDFDASGKNLLLSAFLQSDDLDAATALVAECSESDFDEVPILRLSVATATLLRIVPRDFRQVVMMQPPFDMSSFDLASDPASLDIHRDAETLYRKARDVFRELSLPVAVQAADGYRVWLALSHPDLEEAAKEELRTTLSNPGSALGLVPYALSYGIAMDLDAIEREIDRQVALNGGSTSDTAVARLALALTKKSPSEVARYVERHKGELVDHIDPRALAFLEIEMLAKSGQTEKAEGTFARLSDEVELNEDEVSRLKLIISSSSSDDPTEARRKHFETTNQLTDLKVLVETLEREKDWNRLAIYARQLHERTKSLASAEQLAAALIKTGKEPELLDFLESGNGFLERSPKLRTIYSWALYRIGRVLDAKEAMKSVSSETDYENSYALRRNIAVASGDWQSLNAILAEELELVGQRSPEQLLQSAYLGLQINAPVAKDLLYAAARGANDNPNVLAQAYFLATNAGLENDEEVSVWLHTAAKLSDASGPLRSASIEEIAERQPDWNRHQKNTFELLRDGKVPMFIAAQSINRSLVEMTLTPYLANHQESDPRARAAIPAFSGKRSIQKIPLPKSIGIDPTALLTLGALDAFDILETTELSVRVPHSILDWLFLERQRSTFHQPSRLTRAQNVQDLYADGRIEALQATARPDAKLVAAVGEDLAAFIAEARQIEPATDEVEKYVVRSAPVHRIGSLLNEPLDLSESGSVLVSCQCVVEALASQGRITEGEASKAKSFLQINEQRWDAEPEIKPGSILYLDSLSVVYFQDCGLLEKVCASGFKVVVSKDTLNEMSALLTFRKVSERVQEILERIRAFLQSGIASGKVVLEPLPGLDDGDDDQEFQNHPTFQALKIKGDVDAVLFDDRFLNQHNNLTITAERSVPLITTLELFGLLQTEGGLAPSRYQEFLHSLRCGGYVLIELDADEVYSHLEHCRVVDGIVQENAQLRSLRESIALVRMSKFFQSDSETGWLERSIMSLIKVYRQVWMSHGDLDQVSAKALWLLQLIDLRGWLHCFPQDQADHILNKGRAFHFPLLISAPPEFDDDKKAYFLDWVDNQILQPLKVQFPALLEVVVDDQKKMLLRILDERESGPAQEDGGEDAG